jgi:hypothetical protein
MVDTRKVLKIFLASPSDLPEERRAAKGVVDEINGQFANALGYHVELVGWEDTISGYGRPQAIINAELDHCEFFIGLMWKRWGTRPDHSGPYTSGFEEEFERSIERRKKEGRPEISVLFKEIDADFLRDPGDELKRVIAFKQKLIDGKSVLFQEFPDIPDLERKIRRCVSHYVIRLQAEEAKQLASQNQTQSTDRNAQSSVHSAGATSETPFSREEVTFLHEFISKAEVNFGDDSIRAAEIARFRLISNIVRKHGNDPNSLGVHDANLLFANRDNFVFGNSELLGLMDCGLERYSDENVPFWLWYKAADGVTRELLPMFSVAGGTERKRAGALSAMRLISEPLPAEPPVDRKVFLDRWLAQDEAYQVKVAALGYLADNGRPEDIDNISQELARNDYHTKSATIEAIVRINLRNSRQMAITTLYELQPATVELERNVIEAVFEQGSSLSSETLLAGITHQSSEVRRIVVSLLRKRHALPVEAAERLLTDDSAPVRLEALRSLAEGGRTFSDGECKDILIKPSAPTGLGLLGSGYDSASKACLKQLQEERLQTLDNIQLEDIVKVETIYDQKARFVLMERQFTKYAENLRHAIDDQFMSHFADELENMRARFGTGHDLVDIDETLEEFLRKKLTRDALDVICRRSNAEDLGRVRDALSRGVVNYSPVHIAYLSKFGEWEDIPLIVSAINLPDSGETTLASFAQVTGDIEKLVEQFTKLAEKDLRTFSQYRGWGKCCPI